MVVEEKRAGCKSGLAVHHRGCACQVKTALSNTSWLTGHYRMQGCYAICADGIPSTVQDSSHQLLLENHILSVRMRRCLFACSIVGYFIPFK